VKFITFAFITIFVLCGITIFAQQASSSGFPLNRQGRRAAAFMKFLDSKDDAAIENFIRDEMAEDKNRKHEERVASFRRTREFLAGSKFLRVTSVSPSSLYFLIKTRRESFGKVRIDFATGQEQRIKSIGVDRVSPEEAKASSDKKLTEKETLDKIEKYLKELSKKDEFAGSVIVAKDGKPIFSNAYGYADQESKRKNNLETKFNLGSINKLFTMLAIGILADEGKLSFSDTIGKYLPSYPNKKAREKVTIKHLLTMSSGIGDIFGDEYEATPKSKLRNIKAYLPLFASKPLAFEPGSDRRYSNGGFLVLGAIIEEASGQTYYDFVRERIFKPIGMNDTDSYESDATIPNRAEGYTYSDEQKKRVNNLPMRPARGSSGGGGYSTAPDLLKFSNALEFGKYKTPESLKRSEDQILNGLASGRLRFAGGAPGINAMVLNNIGDGYSVVVLSNYDPPAASSVASRIRGWFGR